MSNRTDFPEQATELAVLFGWPSDVRERVETELHNAFVAGQESQPDPAPTVRLPRYDLIDSLQGPEMVLRPDGFWTPYLTARDAFTGDK